MTRFAVFLRGVNVGGHNKLAMADLRTALDRAGFASVQTYIQSGNIVLRSDLATSAVTARVTDLLQSEFAINVPVLTIRAQDLDVLMAQLPRGADPSRIYVHLHIDAVLSVDKDALVDFAREGEQITVLDRAIVLDLPDGIARSKLAARIAKQFQCTVRNRASLQKIQQLVGDMA